MFGGCILLWILICISCSAQGQLGSLMLWSCGQGAHCTTTPWCRQSAPELLPQMGAGGAFWSGRLMPGSLLPSISIPAAASCPQPMPDCHGAHCHSHPVGCRADFSTVCVKSNTFKSKKCPSLSNDRICFAFAATMKLLL